MLKLEDIKVGDWIAGIEANQAVRITEVEQSSDDSITVIYEYNTDKSDIATLSRSDEQHLSKSILEDIKVGDWLTGIEADQTVYIVQVDQFSDDSITVIYRDRNGNLGDTMLTQSDEHRLKHVDNAFPWTFDAPGAEFKLGLEAYRMVNAAYFDPRIAVHTSTVDPLPHQISAVYEYMLQKQPLRFVLADDPGAGKTIMAGLLIRELMLRSDSERVLIIAPGSLVEQWQDELLEKFGLTFDIFGREKQNEGVSDNYFLENDQIICKLDQLSRNEDLKQKLKNTSWDLTIIDEAHKLSAYYYSEKIDKTKRFQLGELLGSISRHFLLITATPHRGKEEDFQIWLSLLDSDRFYTGFRDGIPKIDVPETMRRMVKEELLKFDGTKLFPARHAYTTKYQLSKPEAELYGQVTAYVGEEMNRADKLGKKNKNVVGFALTMLQRQLASSPEAIYKALERRYKRLGDRLEQTRSMVDVQLKLTKALDEYKTFDEDDHDLDAKEQEEQTEEAISGISAAETIAELEAEISSLEKLTHRAREVWKSKKDRKWEELSQLLQDHPEMFKDDGNRRKLIIFTEYKDTLNYLVNRISDILGSQAIQIIHGSISREARRQAQEEFRNNPEVTVLLATDAAGEGVNLQNANLMINYDLPWNPNRLEQRFGRIHRIGQTEICYLWNMVSSETREGAVFNKLFEKLESAKKALGGKVFDVLGEAFINTPLKDLLIGAIRYGESPEKQAEMQKAIDNALDTKYLEDIFQRRALVETQMGLGELYGVKTAMDKAEVHKLHPHFVCSFFIQAFHALGGDIYACEPGRFEVTYIPPEIENHYQKIKKTRLRIPNRYDRICFEKKLAHLEGKPVGEIVHLIHPLVHATASLTFQKHQEKLLQGTVLVNPNDNGLEPQMLFVIDHVVRETGEDLKPASRRFQFILIDKNANAQNAGWAPHLDLAPIADSDYELISDVLHTNWLNSGEPNSSMQDLVQEYAANNLAPAHLKEIRDRREREAGKILTAVNERLGTEINHLSERVITLEDAVQAGSQPQIQLENARHRLSELKDRLEKRQAEIEVFKTVVSHSPIIKSVALVIPQGLLATRKGEEPPIEHGETQSQIERIAMDIVKETEQRLGCTVKDVSGENCGWDITSRPNPNDDGSIKIDRHIEVRGLAKRQTVITVTRSEIMYALNQSDSFILAIVVIDLQEDGNNRVEGPYYIQNPFTFEPELEEVSINLERKNLIKKSVWPENTI